VADKHPYLSGSGPLFQIVSQLRKSFPAGGVTAETLKKLGLAPNNETYVINILRFIEVIDDEGRKTPAAGKVFSQHDDSEFQKSFAALVEKAYSDLFSLHGKDTWKLEVDALIQYFRSADDTSAIVGRRQATTFQALSALSGHADLPTPRSAPVKKSSTANPVFPKPAKAPAVVSAKPKSESIAPLDQRKLESPRRDVGLTVRVEINLPADGDQETYDRIFKSIRENLIDAE
jgi:hypothetical protein